MRSKALSLVLISIEITFLFCIGCNEIEKKHFDNLDSAKQSHLIEKGWIPDFIPPDSRDIRLESDIDMASVYGRFSSSDIDAIRKHCSSAEDSFRLPGHAPTWYPKDFGDAVTAGHLKDKGYEVLRCDQGGFNIAIHALENEVFYWSIRN